MRKKYSHEEREIIINNYLKKFEELPPTPIGFGINSILDLMEQAVERGEPLKWDEYQNRFHYKKDVTY